MGNSWFRFREFTVRQEEAAMKVGTDGVLLGAWASVAASGYILDIGTGTGLLALMAAQRSEDARIDAIDIAPEAVREAARNCAESPWAERIAICECSVFGFTPEIRYNSILCNPPFFVKSLKNPDAGKTLARHCSDTFSHSGLLQHVSDHLAAIGGTFSLILPLPESIRLTKYAEETDMHLSRLTEIIPLPGKAPSRHLMEFVKNGCGSTEYGELLLYSSPNVRSEAHNKLTADFYLG